MGNSNEIPDLMRYHFIATRMVTITTTAIKTPKTASVDEGLCWKPHAFWLEYKMMQPQWETSGGSSKSETENYHRASKFTPGMYQNELKNKDSYTCM